MALRDWISPFLAVLAIHFFVRLNSPDTAVWMQNNLRQVFASRAQSTPFPTPELDVSPLQN